MGNIFKSRGLHVLGVLIGWGALSLSAIASPLSVKRLSAQQAYDAGQYRQAFLQWQTLLNEPSLSSEQQTEIAVNQGLALQQLGQSQQACLKFVRLLNISPQICQNSIATDVPADLERLSLPSTQHFFAALFLSQVLGNLGKYADSSAILAQISEISPSLEQGRYISLVLLEQTVLNHRKCNRGLERSLLSDDIAIQSQQFSPVLAQCQRVFQNYEMLFTTEETRLQSQLNWLDLFLTLQKWNQRTAPQFRTLQAVVTQNRSKALATWNHAFRERLEVDDANLLEPKLRLLRQGLTLHHMGKRAYAVKAFERADAILKKAKKANNAKIQAIAYQLMGDLYHTSQQEDQAVSAYRLALTYVLQTDHPARSTQIYQSLAESYLAIGRQESALDAYENAIRSLDTQVSSSNLQALSFSFQEHIEAIHHGYMQLLLQQSNPDYDRIIAINDQLRVKELINYLRCGALELDSLVNLPQPQTPTHFIHILQLDQAFHVVAQFSSGDYIHYQPNSQTVEQSLNRLLLNLRSDTFVLSSERAIQRSSKVLYDELLEPIAQKLQPNSTLVFSLDSQLHRLPMALLYDGQQYLFEKYQLSTNFGLQIATTSDTVAPLDNVLIAGLSTVSPSFQQLDTEEQSPLVNVKQETQTIADLANQSDVLLNQSFTVENLQQQLYRQNYPFLHIATHGSFSSDPQETYLLAWDQKIKLPDFERLLQSLSQQGQSLALLVLSACETAQGDRRAALGLAGLAIQSGAQTTVASLWKVDDQATADFMKAFYQALSAGEPKAQALRQAQIELKQSETYSAPYYWAPFVLLGDWR